MLMEGSREEFMKKNAEKEVKKTKGILLFPVYI